MIISHISGGLGNQMFQYAMARALSLRNKTNLYLDISSYESSYHKNAPRVFELNKFNIQAEIATSKDFKDLGISDFNKQNSWNKIKRFIYKNVDRIKPINKRIYIVEKTYNFSPEVYNAGPNCFLSGVWQSEKYFLDIKDLLVKEFAAKEPLGPKAMEILKLIRETTSISIHVRRGDYISHEETNKKHGACPISYYNEAITLIKERCPNSHIFFFSDDIEWVRNSLIIDTPHTYVSNAHIKDTEEMELMKICDHNIIANSSFSWWGAWLNTKPNKIVVAPKQWLASRSYTPDILPEAWIKI